MAKAAQVSNNYALSATMQLAFIFDGVAASFFGGLGPFLPLCVKKCGPYKKKSAGTPILLYLILRIAKCIIIVTMAEITTMTTPIEHSTSQPKPPIWPSLKVASSVSDLANIVLVISLVLGVISTALIVWMSGVKEEYWDRSREDSEQTIAELNKETARLSSESDRFKLSIAEANSRAAEATQKANEADVARLKLEAELAPRFISPSQQSEFVEKLKPCAGTTVHIWVFPAGTPADAAPLANLVRLLLKRAGWHTAMFISIGGQTNPGIGVASRATSQSAAAAGLLVESLHAANINAELFQPYDVEPEFGSATSPTDNATGEHTIVMRIGAKQ